MTSMNVSLPQELKAFAEEQTKHAYSTPSEYVRELIRADQRRRAKEKLEALLTRRVTLRPRARIDLLGQFVFLGEESGIEPAERYFAAAEETCSLLATHPQMGAVYETRAPELKGMRRFSREGFR